MSPVTLTSQLGNTKINDKNSANFFFKSKKYVVQILRIQFLTQI